MPRDKERTKLVTRRAAILGGLNLGLFATLIGRMYYLQVVEADKYALLAEQNRVSLRLLPQVRGRIFDRNGVAVATNQQNYRALVVPEDTDDLAGTLDSLAGIFALSDHDRDRIRREAGRLPGFLPVLVRENLTWEEVSRIEVNAPDLPGVNLDVGQTRDYPFGELGSHVIGYVAAVSAADLRKDNAPELDLPGFRIGKAGVEKVYDRALRGTVGTSQVEVNSVGRVIRELARDDGDPGDDLHLSLDFELQQYAMQCLGDQSAAAVVLDIHSGEVMVMASNPSFDPNEFSRGLSSDEWHTLTTNPLDPLTNKAIAGQYAPGSTFKVMTAMAALESGAITPDFTVFCPGQITLGDSVFHCWKHGGHGLLDLVGGLKNSCDVYFYETARRAGIDRIAEMARRFGLGSITGVDLVDERPGLIPDRAWKEAKLKQPWDPGETLIVGIGQGYVTTTPLQLAVMTARIANNGRAIRPRVGHDLTASGQIVPETAPDWQDMGLSQQNLATIHTGMYAVVNEQGGTVYSARITDPTMTMAGKSGTAQVHRLTAHERELGMSRENELPWKDRDNSLFIAYAPVNAPRFAISVCVEHGGGIAEIASTIARDILIAVQKRYPAGAPGNTTSSVPDEDERGAPPQASHA